MDLERKLEAVLCASVLVGLVACQAASADVTSKSPSAQAIPSTSCDFTAFHPKKYPVFQLQEHDDSITIDGNLDDPAWRRVDWTEKFMDIQGEDYWSQPWFKTRAKMRYDEAFL